MPAVSKKQQKFFGIVRAIQKGEMAPTTPETAKAAADMKKGDVKKFASTKHKGLPEKKKIEEDRQIKKIIKQLRKSVKAHDKQADTLEKKVKTFKESNFTNITVGNKIGQTFRHVSGATVTVDNTMSNSSDQQQTVSIAGELVAAPTGNELGIAGVTMPLGKKKKKKKDNNVLQINTKKSATEINQQLDASEKASGAETAKVGEIKDPEKFSISDGKKFADSETKKITAQASKFGKEILMFTQYILGIGPKVIDNNYLGKDHVNKLFKDGFINDQGNFAVDDFIVGSGQRVTYDPSTDMYAVSFNYDFSLSLIHI